MVKTTEALFDGRVLRPDDATGLMPNTRVRLTIETSDPASEASQKRPLGLCEGEFVVPENFNDPLPESILRGFEGG